jgi:hypothetical protein
MSAHTVLGQTLVENGVLLDTIIGKLLGQGLGHDDWRRKLESLGGFTWSENIKNIIIKKEFGFFKEEILRLMSEPNKSRRPKSKTNSLESILKRLQGLEWADGMPNEMNQRRRGGRLLGKDAKSVVSFEVSPTYPLVHRLINCNQGPAVFSIMSSVGKPKLLQPLCRHPLPLLAARITKQHPIEMILRSIPQLSPLRRGPLPPSF